MAFFTQAAYPSLYLASNGTGNVGAVAFVAAEGAATPDKPLDLAKALSDQTLAGSFVFSSTALNFNDDKDLQKAFVEAVWIKVSKMPASRGILWIGNSATLAAEPTVPFLGLSADGTSVASGLSGGTILPSLSLSIQNGMTLTLTNTTLAITSGSIGFTGSSAPDMTSPPSGSLPFDGTQRGCVLFTPYIKRQSLYDDWNWGFHFVYPDSNSPQGLISEWLPLAAGYVDPTDMIGFAASIDLADPLNNTDVLNNQNPNRSSLVFTGTNQNMAVTSLSSFYRTVSGDGVTLTPVGAGAATADIQAAGLTFAVGQRISQSNEDFHAGPFGDFVIDAKFGPNGVTSELLCGLSGSEFVSVTPGSLPSTGSRFRFFTQCGAYTSAFPPPIASPTGPPSQNTALLTTQYTTSWATVLPPSGKANTYAAQPDGAALFGYDDYVWKNYNSMLGHVDPAYVLPADGGKVFPIVPYAGFTPGDGVSGFSQDQSRKFETLIIGPSRRSQIGKNTVTQVVSARQHASGIVAKKTAKSAAATSTNFTTPSGVIATVATNGGGAAWQQILLGQIKTPVESEMAFKKPTTALQQAFQTNQLFLVAANGENFVDAGGSFANKLNIGGWTIEADVGNSPQYGDYANIMIVKGIEGPLYDPNGDPDKNLISNPDKWTQKDTFAAPTIEGTDGPQTNQMVDLSQWLQDYFKDALTQSDTDFFDTFNTIAKDKNWTGILVLRAKIAAPPDDLAGITAGIRDNSSFYAHHLAIEISQIKSDPKGDGVSIDKQSSVFGLIYYIDPSYNAQSPGAPVAPAYGESYDFITLTLKVLFENTAVKQFASFTQLALNQLFGSHVAGMGDGGNQYNSVIMSGSFQNNNGKPTYGMKALGDYSYLFNSNVLNKIEVISAEMNTISTDAQNTLVRFGLSGFIDFLELDGSNGEKIDLYSFGSNPGEQTPRTGLSYTSLGLNMAFETPKPVATRSITFDSSQIAFNLTSSTIRAGSLFDSLSLDLQSLVSAKAAGGDPKSLGYLDVVTNVRLGGVSEDWNGLKFKLNLGTAGDMAGKVGLNAYLLLAWSPDSVGTNYRALTSVHMPGTANGASLISLQNVLTMSYGTIQLLYTDKPGTLLHPTTLLPVTGPNGAGGTVVSKPTVKADANGKQFMFVLNEIAIKFMGLLKIPPNGSTAFYLFGDADKTGGSGPDNTGLAWYAAYNNEPKTDLASAGSKTGKITENEGTRS